MSRPVLITGAPRSGKTLVAGILQICGVFSGNTDKMLENIALKDKLMKPYLVFEGADPEGLKTLPATKNLSIPADWKQWIENEIQLQGYGDAQRNWMFKSAKIALTWPVWNYHYPDAKYIIVRRRTGDIIQSCLKTGYMRAYDSHAGWLQMVRQYEDRFVEMISEGINCKVIWPDRMVNGDYSQVYEMLEWLNLPWKTEILPYVDPKFWKLRKNKKI